MGSNDGKGGGSSGGSRPAPGPGARPSSGPEPQQHWQNKSGLSVMKAIAPLPEAAAPPARPVTRSLDPPVAHTPSRPRPAFVDPAPSPMPPSPAPAPQSAPAAAPFVPNWETSGSRAAAPQSTVAAAKFIPNWETSASRAAAEAAAAAAAPPPPPIASEPVKPKKKLNASLQLIRGAQETARRVVLAGGIVLGLVAVGVFVFASMGADERAAGPPVDPAIDARQRELTAKGNAERNALKAIVIYDEAIALAPRAQGARDALLGRAKRFLDAGQLDAATADINSLRIRADVGAVSDQIEALTARLKQKRP